MVRRIERGDATCQALPDAEMPCSPGHFLASPNQSAGYAVHRALTGMRDRCHVQIGAATKIKDALDRRVDLCRDFDDRHSLSVYSRVRAYKNESRTLPSFKTSARRRPSK